ncbi:MAG: hypothetical protein HY796_01770 [Elusimicrobia bacterium]|nr:hypothetical protein [Elusimicrobiota bacterium]
MVILKFKHKFFLIGVIGIFCLLGFACDLMVPPYISNGSAKDIYIQIYYLNGEVSGKLKFLYREKMCHRKKGEKVKSIKIFDKTDKLTAEYPEEYLDNLRKSAEYKDEFWVITEKALYLVPQARQKGNDWLEYVKTLSVNN